MNQCPICKSFQPDGQLFCPDCGSRLFPVPHETEEKEQPQKAASYTKTAASKSSGRALIVLVVLLIAALIGDLYFYYEYSSYSDRYWDLLSENWKSNRDLTAAEEELATAEQKLAGFSELSNLCSYGTDDYFADKYVLVVSKFGTKNVAIHWKGSGSIAWHNSDTDKATCKWADEWSDSSTIDAIVTGVSSGYSILNFTSEETDDTFDVLVIVTD